MRNNIFYKTAFFSISAGIVAGVISALFSEDSIIDDFAAWLMGFYSCEGVELWIKASFICLFFQFAVLLSGAFVLGYLFVLPINFHFGYTFGFLLSCAILCFGKNSILSLALKIPTIILSALILCKSTVEAIVFSLCLLSGHDQKTIRQKTAQYLTKCIIYTVYSILTLVYDVVLIPKILNLWVSF